MTPMPGQRTVTYSYTADKLNRSSVWDSATGQTTNYTPSQLNQYTNVGGMGYNYDAKFNLTLAAGFSAAYDAANRLVSASNSGTQAAQAQAEVELVYDGLGRCVKRTIGGAATIIIYDGWKPIAEWDGWTEAYFQAWNVYGPGADEILLRHDAQMGYVRYHPDANGNVAFLLYNNGQVVEKYTYDVFGRPKIMGPGGDVRTFSHWGNRFLFQGREYIEEIGVYDYRNRFYYPDLGRFLQIDPTGFDAGDMNLFRYCAGDPVNRADPMGLTGEIFDAGEQEAAVDVARSQVETANSDPGRRSASAIMPTKGGGRRVVKYYPSKMVPVYHRGKGYEVGATVDGRIYTANGESYELEYAGQSGRRVAVFVHGHNDVKGGKKGDRPGIAQSGYSKYDKALRNVDRTDESNPGVWYSRRNGKDVGSDRASREKANGTGSKADGGSSDAVSGSHTDAISSVPSATDVDLAHQATGVPSLGAESINFAPGPR